MLTTFDHVTIAVADFAQARDGYERLLGTPPTFLGDHPDLATDVALFGLSNAAVELVAAQRDAAEAEGLRSLLAARGEGLTGLAFGTDDAAVCSSELRARGLRATAAQPGEARAHDGALRSYRTVELSTRNTRGLQVLAVERPAGTTLRAARRPADSALEALDHVVIGTRDVEAATSLYGDALGLRLALDRKLGAVRMLFFRIGGVTVEVVEDEQCDDVDALRGLAYRTRDLDAAHARLSASGFELSEPRAGRKQGTRVFSVRSGTCGVPTLIIRDPARD